VAPVTTLARACRAIAGLAAFATALDAAEDDPWYWPVAAAAIAIGLAAVSVWLQHSDPPNITDQPSDTNHQKEPHR
jgi:hypothetical protein